MIRRVSLTYWTMAWLFGAALQVCRARWRVLDAHLMPNSGPLIVVSNHLSFLDPPVLASSAPRRMAFLAKEELKDHPGSAFILWAMGSPTVRRGRPDRAALRTVLDLLKRGEAVLIFPEGTRSRNGVLQHGQPGAALLAQWSGAPLLPVALWGTETVKLPGSLCARPELTVRFGEPFTLNLERGPDRARPSLEAATETIMRHIAALLPERYQGAYRSSAQPDISDRGTQTWMAAP